MSTDGQRASEAGHAEHPRQGGRGAGGLGVWLLAYAAGLLLFGLTAAPDVLMMDSGEYQVAVHRFPKLDLGDQPRDLVRVHPVYLALAKLVTVVPIGNLAGRVNFASALFGAVAVANAALLAWLATRSRFAAAIAALALLLGHTLWAFSALAEVMSLLAVFVTAELLLCWRITRPGGGRGLWLLGLVNGLGVAAHLQLGLHTIVYVVVAASLLRAGRARRRDALAAAVAWLVGTLPYSGLVAYYAFTCGDWPAVLVSATRGEFGAPPSAMRATTLARGLGAMLLNYPTLLVLWSLPGLRAAWSRRGEGWPAAVVGVAVVQWLFAMTYAVADQYSFFVPFYAVAAVLIGWGASKAASSRWLRLAVVVQAVLPPAVFAVLPALLRAREVKFFDRAVAYRDPYDFFIKPWKAADRGQRRYVDEAFDLLPANAVLLASRTTVSMLQYAQIVEGRRPDVTLQTDAASLPSYLSDGPAWSRPVFATDVESRRFPAAIRDLCGIEPVGVLWRVGPPRDAAEFASRLSGRSP